MEYERPAYPDRRAPLSGYLRRRHTNITNNQSREEIFTSSLPSRMLRNEFASVDRNPRSTLKKQAAVEEDEFIEDIDG